MEDVLNQGEVDALLASLDTSDASKSDESKDTTQVFTLPEHSAEQMEIRPYDFKRPERVSKDQMRALEQLHENFARNFGAALSGFLRTIVEVKVANIEQLTYAEFIQGLPNPTCFNLLSCKPLEGRMCLEVSPLIIYPIIDCLLGGSNAELFVPQRPLTGIEQRLVSKITYRAMDAMAEAWENITPINFKLEQTESNPQLVQIVPPNEVVVVVGCEVKMASRAGTMSLCIPFTSIESVVEKLASQSWNAYRRGKGTDDLRHTLSEQLNRAPLLTTAILAETSITLNDLLNMSPGDVVVTDKSAAQPVVLSIEDKKKFLANLGQFKGNRALKIKRPITSKDRV